MISARLRILLAIVPLSLAPGIAPALPAAAPAPASSAGPKIVVGQPAPPFSFKTFDRTAVTSEQLRGKVIVINLWATWCTPCKSEMPMMDNYYRANRHKGLEIIGVQTEDSLQPYKLKAVDDALAYPLALSFRGSVYKNWTAVPTSYVIDRRGIVRFADAGVFTLRSFDALLRPLLAEPAPEAPPMPTK